MEWNIRRIIALEVAGSVGLMMGGIGVITALEKQRETIVNGYANAVIVPATGACVLRSVEIEGGTTTVEVDFSYPSHDDSKLPSVLNVSTVAGKKSLSETSVKGGPGSVQVSGRVATRVIYPRYHPPILPGIVTTEDRAGNNYFCGLFAITPGVPVQPSTVV